MERLKLPLALVSGPLSLAVVLLLPVQGLSTQGRIVLGVFLWAVTWWVTKPVPWGVTSLLPLVLFPSLGVMDVTAAARLYGQTIFFWILGLALFGYAVQKHGLARRLSLAFLGARGVAGSSRRLLFRYMLVTGLISMFVSDAATVAMMIPVGISLLSFLRTVPGRPAGEGRSPLATAIVLGTLYGAVAGGVATLAGLPFNALSVSLLEQLTGESIGWFRWMKAGVPIFVVLLLVFYGILRYFFPPEIEQIPGGLEFIREEARRLGPMTRGEKNVLAAFVVLVLLFTVPPMVPVVLGEGHGLARWIDGAFSIWSVPPIVMLLLFAMPLELKKRTFTLSWRDAADHAPWDIMLLCTSAVAMTEALTKFGFVDLLARALTGFGIGRHSLPFVAAFSVVPVTEFVSGTASTALFGNIYIPLAASVGFNPASMAMLIPNVALGLVFPWAGATAATVFASGELDLKDMIRVGLVANVAFATIVALMHLLFAPIF